MAQRLTAADFDPEVLMLFDAYVHGALDRRGFLDKAKKYAVGGMSAAMLLDALSPKFAEAQQVKKDDARLETSFVEFPSPQGSGTARGYLVRPANSAGKKLPAILVVHENRGLNPHIEDIARRIGLDGYMAFAPDALFPAGGYPGDEDKARTLFQTLDQPKTREDFVAAAGWLRARPDATGKIGAVGFCYGGAIVNMLATRVPELAAGRAVLRRRRAARRRAEDQGGAAAAVRRDRRARERRLAALRSGAEGGEGPVRGAHLPRHAARVQQRHHAALRREERQAGVGADDGALRQAREGLGRRSYRFGGAGRPNITTTMPLASATPISVNSGLRMLARWPRDFIHARCSSGSLS